MLRRRMLQGQSPADLLRAPVLVEPFLNELAQFRTGLQLHRFDSWAACRRTLVRGEEW
jgi:hypothetical protein